MVKIIEARKAQNKEGKEFISLKLQGNIEALQSQQTGKMYLSARTCYISSTFDEATAQALIGTQLPGIVRRVASDPYQYTIKATGEVITLAHRYEYSLKEEPAQPEEYQYPNPVGRGREAYLAEL